MLKDIEPTLLYIGTPEALMRTINASGTANLAQVSSRRWSDWRCRPCLSAASQAAKKLVRAGGGVIKHACRRRGPREASR